MRLFLTLLFATLLINSAYVETAYADVRYVSDVLYVPMRSGKGSEFRIINKGLRSGTKLTLLQAPDPDSEWVNVETESGVQGWVRRQYLVSEPVAKDKLLNALKTTQTLKSRGQKLQQRVDQLQQQNVQLAQRLGNSNKHNQTLDQELAQIKRISANAIDLNSRHQRLMEEHQVLQTEIDMLKAENERLGDSSTQTWFLYGAAAVGFGVFIALVVPALRSRTKYSEWR